jgi:hypothetical protein
MLKSGSFKYEQRFEEIQQEMMIEATFETDV